MSLNEKSVTITANTSTGDVILIGNGEGEVSIDFISGSGTVNYHTWSEAFQRGPSIRAAVTADDVFTTKSRAVEIVVTNASSLVLEVFRRPMNLS